MARMGSNKSFSLCFSRTLFPRLSMSHDSFHSLAAQHRTGPIHPENETPALKFKPLSSQYSTELHIDLEISQKKNCLLYRKTFSRVKAFSRNLVSDKKPYFFLKCARSLTFKQQLLFTSRFPGLISRCNTRDECKYFKPEKRKRK